MVIDFTEIKSDHAFENFCMHLLQKMGLNIPVPPAIGQDGGRDIVCEQPNPYAAKGYRWLVSCKHFAGSRNSVGVNGDAAKQHKLAEHDCNGFMFFYSTGYTENLRSSLEKVCGNINSQYKIFNSYEIEHILLSSPTFYPIIRQYFPVSHARLVNLQNSEACCDKVMPHDALYAVYTADANNMISYRAFGECCLEYYTEHLQENNILYGISKIRNESY